MKYFLIAGEKSGDLHAGSLTREIAQKDTNAQMQGWGGSKMQEAGVDILQNYAELAFMGLDFIRHFGRIRRLFKDCKRQIENLDPDVVILVDYSGFNLRLARWAKKRGFKTVYYIAPKTWAWNASRNKKIQQFVDRLLVILPFEETYFKKNGIVTKYVGNPLVERISAFEPNPNFRETLPKKFEKIVALLPGSRKKEIERVSGELKKVARHFENTLFVVAGLAEMDRDLYESFACIKNCELIYDQTYELLAIADAAIVTSGTATLEVALFNVPQVVVYKAGILTYFIGSKLIKVKYISLVNLILDAEAVPELIQDKFNSGQIKQALLLLLGDTKAKTKQLIDYKNLKHILGSDNASEKAAQSILTYLKQNEEK